MKVGKLFHIIIGVVLLVSCGQKYEGFEKSDTGLYYKFYVENSTNHIPVKDEIVYMSMSIKTENDSLVQDSKQITTAMQFPKFKGDVFDALSMMHEGDSAVFIINAKQYYNIYNYGQVPNFVKNDKTMLWFAIKVDSAVSYQEYQTAIENQRKKQEQKAIADYIEKNNIKVTHHLPSGLYYIETKAGRGNFPQIGQACTVVYTGKLLDGTVFDSSVGREPPFAFQLGLRQVIQGWDEGIALMKKTGKAILIIPSHLAYGERGAGGGSIPPYSPLVFEVELLDM